MVKSLSVNGETATEAVMTQDTLITKGHEITWSVLPSVCCGREQPSEFCCDCPGPASVRESKQEWR